MKRIAIVFLSYFLILALSNCSTDNNSKNQSSNLPQKEMDNTYLKEYASGYTIEVKGIQSQTEVEAYALTENGEAKWLWIVDDGDGVANVKARKTGTWTASESRISISIQGNSGIINEEYVLRNGIFINTSIKDRYLKISN